MKNIFTFMLLLGATVAFSQNDIGWTHFGFNRLAYNPAYAGGENTLSATAIYRNQWWSGVEGSPKNISVNVHTPLGNFNNALGLEINTDDIGLYNRQNIVLSYAYRLRFSEQNYLGLGIDGQLGFSNVDWLMAQGLQETDNLIGQQAESRFAPNVGLGAYLSMDKFYAGVSMPLLLKNTFYLTDNAPEGSPKRTLYAMAGLDLPLTDKIDFQPHLLASINGAAPFDLDINANLLFFKTFMLGLSYRLDDSLDGLLQYRLKNGLRLGVAVDFTTSALNKATTGSYELYVGYVFPCTDCNVENLRHF